MPIADPSECRRCGPARRLVQLPRPRLGRRHRRRGTGHRRLRGVEPPGRRVDLGQQPIVLGQRLGGVVDGSLRAEVVAQGAPGPGESGLHPDLHRQIGGKFFELPGSVSAPV